MGTVFNRWIKCSPQFAIKIYIMIVVMGTVFNIWIKCSPQFAIIWCIILNELGGDPRLAQINKLKKLKILVSKYYKGNKS